MLERLGVELVFGLPGVHNLPIWKALSDSHIRLVGVRHEQTAAYAADGYARATGRLGVALVTTGPGRRQHARRHRRGDGGGLAGARHRHRHPRRRFAAKACTEARCTRRATRPRCSCRSRRPRGWSTARRRSPPRCSSPVRPRSAAQSGPVYLGIPTDLLSQPVAPAPVAVRRSARSQPRISAATRPGRPSCLPARSGR